MSDINIKDYLSEEEMKNIVRDAFKEKCLQEYREDHERMLSNVAYDVVAKMVDRTFNGNLEAMLMKSIIKIINELTDFNVFSKAEEWCTISVGQTILEKCVTEQKDRLDKKVSQIIDNLGEDRVCEALHQGVYRSLHKVFQPEEDK